MRPLAVEQLVLVPRVREVGHDRRGAAGAEEAVGDEHGAVAAVVPEYGGSLLPRFGCVEGEEGRGAFERRTKGRTKRNEEEKGQKQVSKEEDPLSLSPKKTSKTSTLSLAHQLAVMFSWLTISTLEPLRQARSMCLAASTQTSELEQPMPASE